MTSPENLHQVAVQRQSTGELKVGVSYDEDQVSRLQGNAPPIINIFTLKAIAVKLRHRASGFKFKKKQDKEEPGNSFEAGKPLLEARHGDSTLHSTSSLATSVKLIEGPSNLEGLYTILAHPMCSLLVCVPLGITSSVMEWGDGWSFWLNFLALIPLAKILGDATEELAAYIQNDTISGLLNASFGNAVEMIVAVQALRANLMQVVKLSLLGSVLSNILLVLGCAFFLGGLSPSGTNRGKFHSQLMESREGQRRYGIEKEQKFATKSALLSMAMLLFSCMSFALPTIFSTCIKAEERIVLAVSRKGAWLVLSAYAAFLIFQLLTHRRTLAMDEDLPVPVEENPGPEMGEEEEEEEDASISPWCSISLMAACSVVTAFNSEALVNVINGVVHNAGIPESFISVILLPIAGNACEHASAVRFAMNDRPGLAIGISVGSATQVALLVVPFSVIAGSLMNKNLDLDFGALNCSVVTFSVMVVTTLLFDGRSNWMKGYLLMVLYGFIAMLYWYLPTNEDPS